MNFANTASVNS